MIIPVGYYQWNGRFTGPAAPSGAEVTLGLHDEGATGGLGDIADDINAAFAASVVQYLSTQVTFSGCLLKAGPNDLGPFVERSASQAGQDGGSALPPNVSVLVLKQTGFGGRANRGRMFLPGFREDSVDASGIIDPTKLGNLQDALDDFFGSLTSLNLEPSLLHSESSPVATPTEVLSFVASNKVATQRRRLRR